MNMVWLWYVHLTGGAPQKWSLCSSNTPSRESTAQLFTTGPLSLVPGDIGTEGDVGVRKDGESSVGDIAVLMLDDVDRFRDRYGRGNGLWGCSSSVMGDRGGSSGRGGTKPRSMAKSSTMLRGGGRSTMASRS